jgi:hypothetical protein
VLSDRFGGRRTNRYADMHFACALRIDTRHHIGAIRDHLFGPEGALLSGDAEHDNAIFLANDHCAAFTAARMASSMNS